MAYETGGSSTRSVSIRCGNKKSAAISRQTGPVAHDQINQALPRRFEPLTEHSSGSWVF